MVCSFLMNWCCDSYVEFVPIVESAGDECLSDCSSGLGGDPLENLSEHSEGEKTS